MILCLFTQVSIASGLVCHSNVEYSYSDLTFKKDSRAKSGLIVLVDTSSGKKWVPAYEQFIAKKNGLRISSVLSEGKVFEACGELNSDGLSISKISVQ